ncbi:hypothetical protein FRX31_028961, partial [Thalictrum thalictroides]
YRRTDTKTTTRRGREETPAERKEGCVKRGGKYSDDDAMDVMIQILNVVVFCHLQGVVHRDLNS